MLVDVGCSRQYPGEISVMFAPKQVMWLMQKSQDDWLGSNENCPFGQTTHLNRLTIESLLFALQNFTFPAFPHRYFLHQVCFE